MTSFLEIARREHVELARNFSRLEHTSEEWVNEISRRLEKQQIPQSIYKTSTCIYNGERHHVVILYLEREWVSDCNEPMLIEKWKLNYTNWS